MKKRETARSRAKSAVAPRAYESSLFVFKAVHDPARIHTPQSGDLMPAEPHRMLYPMQRPCTAPLVQGQAL